MIDNVLSRFEGVKSTGKNRWICKCSAHQDKSPSLAISVEDDGRILMKCFAGCDTYSILQSAGLDWQDVFPSDYKGEKKPKKGIIYPSEGLRLLQHETRVLLYIGYEMRNGTFNQMQLTRLEQANERISNIFKGCGIE